MMNCSARRLVATACLLMLSALAHAADPASAAAPPAPAASDPDAPVPKIVPLLGFVISQLGGVVFKQVVGDTPWGLFHKLSDRMTGGGAASAPAVGASGADGATTLASTPVVAYSIQQLDASTFESVKSLDVSKGAPMLHTGDVFALQYSTSLPGQVRLENIDPAGAVNDLGTYTVLPDQLNRLPSQKGIKLVGKPGTEVIRFYFYPCMPSGAGDQPWAGAFKGKLPECGRGPNPVMVAVASGTIRAKSLVNLAQPDASMSFAGMTDYKENDVTSTVALIQHEGP